MDWTGEGYGASPNSASSLFIRLRAKGDKVRLRLVSDPVRYIDVFEDTATGERTERRKAAWLAICREVVNGRAENRPVIFTAGPQVYGVMRDLVESDDWGDPAMYDVVVERAEEPGRYYVVTPMPKPMGPLTADEQAVILSANISWPEIVLNRHGRAATSTGHNPDPFGE